MALPAVRPAALDGVGTVRAVLAGGVENSRRRLAASPIATGESQEPRPSCRLPDGSARITHPKSTCRPRPNPRPVTRVCLVGSGDGDVQRELLSRETAREALSTYRIDAPYEDTLAVETVSLGAAVSLLNDLDWYLVRFTEAALVLEPSISDEEWLSRELATAIRNERVDPADSGEFLKVYGVDDGRLVEPLYARRSDGVPGYDLRDVEETLVVRVTDEEFGD